MVREIADNNEFLRLIQGPKLVVVDFFATWCGPCVKISPFVEKLGEKYPDVVFLKVDVEKASDIAQERGLTFILIVV
jgi:thioredoxin 1